MSNEIYEECTRRMRVNDPTVLDDLLEIRIYHAPSAKLLKQICFHISADKQTTAWIKRHPTFKHGCWPIGLFALYDWMWKKKFVDVGEGLKVIDGGTYDPNVGKIRIHAEFENFEEGVWFAPLIYYANTHIFDQLKQFYKDNPKSLPSHSRIQDVITETKIKQARKSNEILVSQMLNRRLLQPATKKAYVLIDESGDVGFKALDDAYVYAPVIVSGDAYGSVSAEIDALRMKHWGKNFPTEIHLVDVPKGKRDALLNDFSEIVLKNDIKVVGCVFEKLNFIKHLFRCHVQARKPEESPLDITFDSLLNDQNYFLKANMLATTVEFSVSHLSLDFLINGVSAVFKHDMKHKQWMNDALNCGFNRGITQSKEISKEFFGLATSPSLTFEVIESSKEPCLWLSDWICHELREWIHGGEISEAFQRINPNIVYLGFSSDGAKCISSELGGHADIEYEDISRLIVKDKPVISS